jgi:hypothetical protein
MKIRFVFCCLFAAICIFFLSISAVAHEMTFSGYGLWKMNRAV